MPNDRQQDGAGTIGNKQSIKNSGIERLEHPYPLAGAQPSGHRRRSIVDYIVQEPNSQWVGMTKT
jgi:hypothetical protein